MNNRVRTLGLTLALLGASALAAAPARAQEATPAPLHYANESAAGLGATAAPARSGGSADDRMFFPEHWVRGYVDFAFAPPHNEPDLGRCSPLPASNFGGAADTCNAYARYLWSGYLEVQPFGRTILRHAFFFFEPVFSFGNNVPQFKYTASMAPIAFDRKVGLGIDLPKNFQFRLTQHQVNWLGRYTGNVGPADLNTPGPYGLYTTIGVRWSFGGYGHVHDGN